MSLWSRLRLARPASSADAAPAGESSAADGTSADSAIGVAGERGVASIHRTLSLQTRVSNVLAAGLMAVFGLGFLAWYYTQSFARPARAESAVQARSKKQAQGEMALPPLGRVDSPVVERVLGPPPDPPRTIDTAREPISTIGRPVHINPSRHEGDPAELAEQQAWKRRLSGPVFVSASKDAPFRERSDALNAHIDSAGALGAGSVSAASDSNGLAGMLVPTSTPAVSAKVPPTQRLLLPKGAFIDCTLETAIDSSLPGMTTCVTATDTFSADGAVVLLERGTKLVGETRGNVRHGSARVFVLWTEARTPEGVVVPLASPSADELGRAGLPGEVDRHFMERFGAAILVSVIDGAVQAVVQRSSDGAVIVNPSTSRDVMTEVLRSTINIPPTVTKRNGDRIAVLVARDLDFRSVYELRPVASSR